MGLPGACAEGYAYRRHPRTGIVQRCVKSDRTDDMAHVCCPYTPQYIPQYIRDGRTVFLESTLLCAMGKLKHSTVATPRRSGLRPKKTALQRVNRTGIDPKARIGAMREWSSFSGRRRRFRKQGGRSQKQRSATSRPALRSVASNHRGRPEAPPRRASGPVVLNMSKVFDWLHGFPATRPRNQCFVAGYGKDHTRY
jgi:hypothetical protein